MTPAEEMADVVAGRRQWAVVEGGAMAQLASLPDACVQTCITSPPYWSLRDYGHPDQIGLEKTPEEYVGNLVDVFRKVRRVLASDGTLWLNLGDSYASGGRDTFGPGTNKGQPKNAPRAPQPFGLKPKDLVGIPWSVAKALQSPYYAGRIKSELDRVWLAATIDAEGSICGFTHERKDDGTIRTGIHLTITNTNRPLLDNAYRIWPTSRQDHNLHGEGHLGSADTYRWIAHNVDDKADLLREIYPYLIAKKKQALLAWNFLEMSKEAKRLARTSEAESVKDRRSWIVAALSRLNHFESVDIPDWCKEPPSCHELGWYLRSDVIWHKPNVMPESVRDRPTKAHEYLFLLARSARYYFDAEAVREESVGPGRVPCGNKKVDAWRNDSGRDMSVPVAECRNLRSVWSIATQPFEGAHFAVMPPALVEPCVKAGSREGDLVLDPFAGAGTVNLVATRLGRRAIGIELSSAYASLARARIAGDAPLFAGVVPTVAEQRELFGEGEG